jgi:hypothetical protein
VLTSTVLTPIRLYLLPCTLYCCTLTRRQPSALVALSSAFVSDSLFQVLQCTLQWLQLSQHFSLAISFINQQFFSKFIFLLEVSRELPQRSTLNTLPVALSIFIIHLHSSALFALTFFRVSHFSLLIFVLSQTCHTFVNSFIFLHYSGFQFLLFLGRVPNKPLDIANLFRPRKHDS